MITNWEYGIVEWLWNLDSLQYFLPDGTHDERRGSYPAVVAVLSELGRDGWEVVGNTASSNWVFWTLKRPIA